MTQAVAKESLSSKSTALAIPPTLLESQLFGYVKDAFTGAKSNQPGAFQKANGGGNKFDDLRDAVVNLVSSLRINLSQVKLKLPVIERVKSEEFWTRSLWEISKKSAISFGA